MQINHRLRVIQLSANALQFGLGAHSLIVDGLTAEDHRLVDALRNGTGARNLEATAARCGVQPARARYLVELLQPVLIGTVPKESSLCGIRADRLDADILQWSVVYERDATPLMERRARSVVRVVGLGRAGSAIAQGLAAAGLGTLLLEDDALVAPSDVGAAAFRLCDVGLRRSAAVRRQVHHIDPTVQVHLLHSKSDDAPANGSGPAQASGSAQAAAFVAVDLVIATSQDAPDTPFMSDLMDHRQAHLPVLLRERDALVGPMVLPGETACLQCIDLHLADMDSPPPASGRLTAVPNETSYAAAEESAVALAAASTAGLQALLFIDGVHRPSSWSSVLQLRAADGSSYSHSYEPHQDCRCRHDVPYGPLAG